MATICNSLMLLLLITLTSNFGSSLPNLELQSLEEYKKGIIYCDSGEVAYSARQNAEGRRKFGGCSAKLARRNSTLQDAAIAGDSYRWKYLYVYIDQTFDNNGKCIILEALSELKRHICIDLKILQSPVPSNELDYIFLKSGKRGGGCSSDVGKVGGEQIINLETPVCLYKDVVMHEVMHALGYWHEHSRADRDEFITIQADYVLPGRLENFRKEPHSLTFRLPYDQNSVMHYFDTAFSVDNLHPTIVAKNGQPVGSSGELTETDIEKLRIITGCKTLKSYYNPEGSTGCGRSLPGQEGGTCWRYCSGSSGDWCYTKPNCDHDEDLCSTETKCGGYTCAAASEGCVKTCNAQKLPSGSTGCSKKYEAEEGRCWRYCKGTSGTWCYTSSHCMKDEDKCWKQTNCSGQSCVIADPGCVTSCE